MMQLSEYQSVLEQEVNERLVTIQEELEREMDRLKADKFGGFLLRENFERVMILTDDDYAEGETKYIFDAIALYPLYWTNDALFYVNELGVFCQLDFRVDSKQQTLCVTDNQGRGVRTGSFLGMPNIDALSVMPFEYISPEKQNKPRVSAVIVNSEHRKDITVEEFLCKQIEDEELVTQSEMLILISGFLHYSPER